MIQKIYHSISQHKYGYELGYEIKREYLIETLGLNPQKSAEVLRKYLGESFDHDHYEKMRIERIHDFIQKNGMPFKEGLLPLLDFLKSNHYKIAVATSAVKDVVLQYFSNAGLLNYFDVIITGDMIKKGKPAPDIYLKAAEKLNIDPSSCIAVEDSFNGILSANHANMPVIMVPDLLEPTKEIAELLTYQARTLDEIIYFLSEV